MLTPEADVMDIDKKEKGSEGKYNASAISIKISNNPGITVKQEDFDSPFSADSPWEDIFKDIKEPGRFSSQYNIQ